MFRKFRTFLSLSRSYKWTFVKIAVLVPTVEVSIRTLKFKRTLKALRRFALANVKPHEDESLAIFRYRTGIYLYQKQFPNLGKCLARSLVLWLLLDREGIKTELRFGVKKDKNGILAHAWIDYRGETLISEPELNGDFTPFSESILAKLAE